MPRRLVSLLCADQVANRWTNPNGEVLVVKSASAYSTTIERHQATKCPLIYTLTRTIREVLDREIYDLQEMEKPADDPIHYLTDGRMTMIISPWSITDFEGAGIAATYGSPGIQS